jgi:hypothetical protein
MTSPADLPAATKLVLDLEASEHTEIEAATR